jgi:Ni/Fe-hydrogenase 1 B-type cytochrome subunit
MAAAARPGMGRIYVWEGPVRVCHWLNVLTLSGMFVSGLYIGWPLFSPSGEAYQNAAMAWMRYVHFVSAYVFLATWIFRIYWFFVGNENARNIFRFWSAAAWKSVARHTREILVADPEAVQELPGQDQLARMWHGMFFTACMFMIFTGFAMYGESNPHSVWAPLTRLGLAAFGTSRALHYWHHWVAWFFPFFVVAHLYQVLRTDILARQGLVSSMISGYYLCWDKDEEKA